MNYLLSLENISKCYKAPTNKITILSDISLTIFPGEFIVIMGPSGSGKTTLLNIMSFADTPDTGTIKLFDNNCFVINNRSYIRSKKIGQINHLTLFLSLLH